MTELPVSSPSLFKLTPRMIKQCISEDLGPYMTFAATEDSTAASEEQTYYGWT